MKKVLEGNKDSNDGTSLKNGMEDGGPGWVAELNSMNNGA